jgi:OCT family organic anion transporter-like MFS transporter 7
MTALVGRLGGSLAPLAALLDGVWLLLPMLAYGGVAILAACTALLLPETRKAKLPETIQDVERKRCVHRILGVCMCVCMCVCVCV